MASFIARNPTEAEIAEMRAMLDYEYEALVALIEADAAVDHTVVARTNDKVRAVLLATAYGTTLDHIGATYYRVERLTGEIDEVYRQRLALSPEAWSTCGPDGAYLFYALASSADIEDVAVYSEDEGVALAPEVWVVILPKAGTVGATADGWASPELLATVTAALGRADRRPLGDRVVVESAVPQPFDLHCVLSILPGVSAAAVIEEVRRRLMSWASGRLRWIGDAALGPAWLIGRTFTAETLAAVGRAGDANIVDIDVTIIGDGVNAPHPDYQSALAGVGSRGFQPLGADLTAHLFRAPRLGAVTIETVVVAGGWAG